MACDDLITNQDLENAKKDATTMSDFVESDSSNIISKNGKDIRTLQGINDAADNLISSLGGVDVGDYENDETLNSYNEYVVFDRAGLSTGPSLWKAIPPRTPTPGTPLPYTIDSTTYPDPTSDPNIEPFSDINKEGAQNIADVTSNAGDSLVAGGGIYPESPTESASTTPPNNVVPPGTKFLNVGGVQHEIVLQDSGTITALTIDPQGGGTVVFDGARTSYLIPRNYEYLTLEMFGGVGDYRNYAMADAINPTPTDNSPALERLQSFVKTRSNIVASAPLVKLRGASYYFSSGWELKVAGIFSGQATGQPYNLITELIFDGDEEGITIERPDTDRSGIVPATDGADGTMIEQVAITAIANLSDIAHAIRMKARAKIRDCVIGGSWGGDGIRIWADDSTSNPDLKGNANSWALDTVRIEDVGGNGVFTRGGDANAGTGIGVQTFRCAKWGINDSSFLGNNWVGGNSDGNGTAARVYNAGFLWWCLDETLASTTEPTLASPTVWQQDSPLGGPSATNPQWVNGGTYFEGGANQISGSQNRSIITGRYVEPGQPPSNYETNAVVLGLQQGPIRGTGFVQDGKTVRQGGNIYNVAFTDESLTYSIAQIEDVFQSYIVSGLSTAGLRFKWNPDDKCFDFSHRTNTIQGLKLTSDGTTVQAGRASPIAEGRPIARLGMWLGDGGANNDRYFTVTSAAPTSGEVAQGDTFQYRNATAGGREGSKCTTGGTAGVDAVFKEYGSIDA